MNKYTDLAAIDEYQTRLWPPSKFRGHFYELLLKISYT